MKNILLNVLAFVAFLAIEIVAVAFMSTYPAGSAAMMLLGLLALVIGGAYTVLLGRDIVNLKLYGRCPADGRLSPRKGGTSGCGASG